MRRKIIKPKLKLDSEDSGIKFSGQDLKDKSKIEGVAEKNYVKLVHSGNSLSKNKKAIHLNDKINKNLKTRGKIFQNLKQRKTETETKENAPIKTILNHNSEEGSRLKESTEKKRSPLNYICQFCGLEFNQICHLKVHEDTHTGNLRFKCEICEKKFVTKDRLKSHTFSHTTVKGQFTCDLCGKKYKREETLHQHVKQNHEGRDPEPKCICEHCGKAFLKISDLTVHVRKHTGEKPFTCEFCQKPFSKKSDMTRHRRIHTKETPYECKICLQKFAYLQTLKKHTLVHDSDKPLETKSDTDSPKTILKSKFETKSELQTKVLVDSFSQTAYTAQRQGTISLVSKLKNKGFDILPDKVEAEKEVCGNNGKQQDADNIQRDVTVVDNSIKNICDEHERNEIPSEENKFESESMAESHSKLDHLHSERGYVHGIVNNSDLWKDFPTSANEISLPATMTQIQNSDDPASAIVSIHDVNSSTLFDEDSTMEVDSLYTATDMSVSSEENSGFEFDSSNLLNECLSSRPEILINNRKKLNILTSDGTVCGVEIIELNITNESLSELQQLMR